MRLIHTGQVILDLVMRVPALPTSGHDVLATTTDLLPGGGLNVMAAAARSGADVLYAGTHGTGPFGDRVRAALHAEGIAIAHPPGDESATGTCVALIEENGERTFITGTGAEGRLSLDDLNTIQVTEADLIYVTGYTLLNPANETTLQTWLATLPGKVLLDPGPLAADLPLDDFLKHVDILSCNISEAQALTNQPTLGTAATALLERLPAHATVIVRTGPSGCTIAHEDQITHITGHPVTPIDTNGAGDTHCGVLAAELLRGIDLETAARRANAAAALSVLHRGPTTAPTRQEITAFLASTS
ncbi:PfkB family carbohydrate kinase [Actinomadura rugatobispora]|uniref:PfkB family carbohydrate kinase n=1 Tax=Actinomadura rugatobispora TaxID=1994 RepID=A0ABW1A0K4_9ACTN|nr:PfkB family carbohydrate kinase [Actinomadura rugatobispora]